MKLKPADWQPLPEVYRLEREREEIPERRRTIARQRMLAILERTGKRQSAPDAPAAGRDRGQRKRALMRLLAAQRPGRGAWGLTAGPDRQTNECRLAGKYLWAAQGSAPSLLATC